MNEAVEGTQEGLAVLREISDATLGQGWDAKLCRPRSWRPKGRGLRVAHLSPRYGGVANAARQLHSGLLEIGVESRLFVTPPPDAHDVKQHLYGFPRASRTGELADRAARLIERHFGLTGMTRITSLIQSFPQFDVIHFHGMDSSWFNLHALPRLSRQHALVWTMHDKHLGTGACGYPEFWGDCERWKSGCGHCPKVTSEGWWMDCTRWIFQRKKRIMASTNLALVAPSRWMFEFIASAPITRDQTLRLIPNGVDTDTFRPASSSTCRKELQLPSEGTLLLSVSSKLDEPRKGLQFYEPILKRLRSEYKECASLVLVGARLPEQILGRLKALLPVYVLGKIDDPRSLAQVYSACDLLLVTSMIDNFPSVVLESLACGTPVAAFRTGGIPDMVEQSQTGILSDPGATDDLAEQIAGLLKKTDELLSMRLQCRERAVRTFCRTVQASDHLRLYHELCELRRGAA